MKLLIFLLLLVMFAHLSPQLKTHYTPLPALQRVKRTVWVCQRPRWAIAVAIVPIFATPKRHRAYRPRQQSKQNAPDGFSLTDLGLTPEEIEALGL